MYTNLDHPLQYLQRQVALALHFLLAVQLRLDLLEVPDNQLLLLDALAGGGLVLVDAPHEQVQDLHVLVVGDLRLLAWLLLLLLLLLLVGAGAGVFVAHGAVTVPVARVGHFVVAVAVGASVVAAAGGGGLFFVLVDFDVVLLDRDDALAEEVVRLADEAGDNLFDAVGLGDGLGESDQRLELADRDAVGGAADAALGVVGAELLVLLDEEGLGLLREDGPERPREPDVPLQLLGAELRLDGLVAVHVHVDDVLCQVAVYGLVGFVPDHEEQVESAHDGGAEVEVRAQRRLGVVPAADRVGGGEDGGASVEGGVDACLGDRDGLLLHGFVDGDLVADVHLVELVNAANASSILGFQVLNQLGALALVWWNDHLRQASGHQPQW